MGSVAVGLGELSRVGALGRTRRVHTLWVVGCALAARVAVVWYAVRHFPAGWFFGRGVEMGLLAQSLVRGEGLSSPFGVATGPTAMIAPGYPLVVAGVFRVCGVFTLGSSLVLMGLSVALNLVTVWLILDLSRRLASERTAVLVSLLWGCSLPVIWMPTIFWETNISAALLLGFVALALRLKDTESWVGWVGCGMYVGVSGLVNPALLPSLGLMAGWAGWKRGVGRMAIAGVAFLMVFSAWPVRNARVFGAFIPTRTTVGFELWMGNRPGGTGYLDESLFPMFNQAELAEYVARGEVGYMGHKEALATRYMWAHPAATLRLTLVRVGRFWFGMGNSKGSVFYVLHALITTLLGGWGLIWMMRRGGAAVLLIPVVVFPLPYYLTHAEFRYRLVLDPLLCVLAAKALDRAVGRERL